MESERKPNICKNKSSRFSKDAGFNPYKAGFFEGSFFGGVVNLTPPPIPFICQE